MTDKPEPKTKIPRQKMPEQAPLKRARNFEQVNLGYTQEQAQREASRCLQCKKPRCVQGCPVHINIPAFIKEIGKGSFLQAAWVIKEHSLLPAVCGRVCPQEEQCERYCLLGKKGQPVAIGNLERFVADYEASCGEMTLPEIPLKTGKRVAIVGSGPAGLTAAGDLIKMGHDVTIFEALHRPGGVLLYGIPEFRLPKAIVTHEVDFLKKLGVKIVCDYVIGKVKTIDQLLERDGFHAVFISTGAGLPMFMNIPGENLNGVFSANEFLTRVNLMKAYEFPSHDTPVKKMKRVAVIGGGNVAMDAVRTSLRLGADSAYIVYRRSRQEMPARNEEIKHAEEEGVKFLFLTSPLKILEDVEGWVKGLECITMELGEPDASGRRRPKPVKGSEFVLDVEEVIISIGTSANPLIAQSTPDMKLTKKGYIDVSNPETCATSKKGVFAGGDIVTGSATVILAMGAGRNAARHIDAYLKSGQWPESE
jgi:glutamate synthase (NADPH/NADH) small chain